MAALTSISQRRAPATTSATVTRKEPETVAGTDSRRSTLLLHFFLFNLLAFALLGAAVWEGYIETVFQADETRLSVAIFGVFMAGLLISFWRAWQISQEIDDLTTTSGTSLKTRQPVPGSLRLRLAQRIAAVRHIANTLVLLGLIGTVLGFIIALSGVDPDNAADVNSIAPMVSVLIQGMSTALYTTLIGSILNVWLMANYQMLSGGTVQVMSLLLDQNDADA